MIAEIIIGTILSIYLLFGIRIVRPIEHGLVETLGKYTGTAQQGFKFIWPIFQTMRKVNVTEIRVDVEPQNIITEDNLNATVDAVVYFKIKEANKALYNVDDASTSVPSLARTTLRAVIGNMTLSFANRNRNAINTKVEQELDKQTAAWGIDIIRVELQKIEPPQDVQDAMNQVVTAENVKIAAKDLATSVETKADGNRRAAIKEAEGDKRSRILKAEGMKTASVLKAEGESKAFKMIDLAFKGNAQKLKELEVTQASLQNNAKIIITEKGIKPSIILGNIPTEGAK